MQWKSKYFTYPVIVQGEDFYIGSSFETNAEREVIGYDIKLSLTAKLINPQLEKMLRTNEISILHHIECPQTCYREIVKTQEYSVEKLIRDADVNGLLQVSGFIVANKDLCGYSNELFASYYSGFKFNIDNGCVMAIGNQIEFRIDKARDDLKNTTSIFSIMPNLDETVTNMKVDLNGQKIAVVLPRVAFGIYKNMSSDFEWQNAMHSMIIVPALEYVVSEIKEARKQLYDYEDRRWFRSLRKTCQRMGIKLTEEGLESINALELAQLLLNAPLIGGMKSFIGTEEEYAD